MLVDQFDFDLPQGLIAQRPAEPRESARLLHVAERFADLRIADLPGLLGPEDLLVLNDTAVLPTRFFARRGEAQVEITLVESHTPHTWWAFARPGRRLQPGDLVELAPGLTAEVDAVDPDGRRLLRFDLAEDALIRAIKARGVMPLPPYIKRPRGGDPADRSDYQAVFARRDGSVAAPTASLHFVRGSLERLADRGINHCFVTLHVGLGTFLPVKPNDTSDHHMHREWYEVPARTAQAIADHKADGGRIVAVGTTVLRTLESMARSGSRTGWTDLFITPGFDFRLVDRLLTNFHVPRSTLFMLVAAFAGLEKMQAAYRYAIARNYRFFSYGDACLLERS